MQQPPTSDSDKVPDNKPTTPMIGGCVSTQYGCCKNGKTAAASATDKCKSDLKPPSTPPTLPTLTTPPTPPLVGGSKTITCNDGTTKTCPSGTRTCYDDSPLYCEKSGIQLGSMVNITCEVGGGYLAQKAPKLVMIILRFIAVVTNSHPRKQLI